MALGRFGAIALLAVGGMLLKKKLGPQQAQAAPERVPMGRTGDMALNDGRDASRVPVLPRGSA
jgi:hypothetical protein